MKALFTPFAIGDMQFEHRVVLAPLTRMRTETGDVPGELMVEYYRQRASSGALLISDATTVTPHAVAYAGAPGIYSAAQVEGWRKVVDAVHGKGAKIFLQIWHPGRQAHPANSQGMAPVAPSALKSEEMAAIRGANGIEEAPLPVPRALETAEIPYIVGQFKAGAELAKLAGFDGVELHGANGYLPDQFLQDGSNQRTDAYGGPVENRARFMLEVVDALVSVFGPKKVAVRLSPSGQFGTMSDSDAVGTFGHVAKALNRFDLAYLHIVEPRIRGYLDLHEGDATAAKDLRALFKGPIIAAGGFDGAKAEAILKEGSADMVAFGRHFISNPDLPERLRRDLPLTPYDRNTFYGGDHQGYTDYPFAS
ncbi:alkene reductase [Gallaecimonas pentaromativorans]|uniref:alkene reductase n=1 Tax=Gallaecimonas pentaromativorans TaxID=584787 RepID=UPI003A93FDE2